MKERLQRNDDIKTAMMILVVLYHSCLFFNGYWFPDVQPVYQADYLVNFAYYLCTINVQGFVMASGFLFYALRKEKGKYQDHFLKDVSKRLVRLMVPYACTSIFWVIPFDVAYDGFDIKSIVYQYVLGCSPSQLWFLPMLFWLFVFHYLLFQKTEPGKVGLCISVAISLAGPTLLSWLGLPNIFQIAATSRYLMFYYLGAYLYHRKPRFSVSRTAFYGALSLITFVLSLAEENGSSLLNMVSLLADRIGPLFGVLAVYGVSTLIPSGKEHHALWNRLQKNSFGIYLFHQQLIYPCITLLNGKVHPVVQALLSFVIAIGGATIIAELLRKCKLTRTMFQL